MRRANIATKIYFWHDLAQHLERSSIRVAIKRILVNLTMEMKEYKLGDLIEVTRGMSLPGEFYSTEGEYIRLTCGNFDYVNNSFKENKSKDDLYYVGKIKPEFIMQKGDIITPLTEQAIGLLGTTAIIPESGKYIQSQDVAKVTCKKGMIDHDFAYYLIPSKCVKEQLSAAAQQTKIRHTSPDAIKACKVFVPPLSEQKKIASVLSALDDKIALNKKMNQKLEAMAKRLYDYWFVQYDFPDKNGHPYKTTGGKMVWNEVLKREIPEGWEVKKLEDCINLFDSKRVPLSSQQRASKKGMIPYYGATGIMDYIDDFIYDGEYILLAEDGSVETDEGFVIIQRIWGKTWVNNHAHVIQPKEKGQYEFYFQVLSSIVAKKITTGSIQKKISQENMNAYKLLAPPKDLILKYCLFVHNSWEKQKKIADENIKLQNLRDNLLPLLMNGQVTVA
jgi:type I restriction enzyme S subunit